MFITQRKLIDNLYYKGYNPKLVLCNLKQDRIIRISQRSENISSPKNGICIIKFTLEDRWTTNKGSYNSFESKRINVNFIVDTKQQKINEIEFRYIAANNSGYIKNLSSIDNINYLLDKNILIYRNYIVGFLFVNYVKKTVESLSKKYKKE
jgi:hypothetical protein|nr:MAG TPA: hypothetical protein [Caudoviricetes sp.]